MSRTVSYFSTETGLVTKVITGPDEQIAVNLEDGEAIIDGDFNGTIIDLVTFEPKPLLTFDVQLTGNAVLGLPEGTRVNVNYDPVGVVDDGELELEADHPQQFVVDLSHDLYEDARVVIDYEG